MTGTAGELGGRTALVTGASKGIGLAVARALAAAGADVVAGSRTTTPELDALVKGGGAGGSGRVRWVEVDLAAAGGPERLVAAAGERIDILVNNVGSAPARPGGFASVTDEDWRRTIELNLLVPVAVTRAVLPGMLAAGGGSIVTVASVNALLPDPLVIDYSAAKAALVNFCKALSKEVGGRGVRINTISPGPVETDLWLGGGGVADTVSANAGLTPQDVVAEAKATIVSGRFSRPDEVADLAVFLAGDRAANILGSDFTVDGGLIPTW
ncbi:Short-chain dehydrogenase [Actinacidiphila alni]|uniref:Short-chain dehydrogenase n=1 Tax=Actinacidiphila alni TaxID=380248 RepID=A0A1I2IK05_9ACTN|nr:SDR family oxidoreductase [Actinacidiphila alni]SFF41176.1 Short-chain dehydrogenase [Actinacidiphila alni]